MLHLRLRCGELFRVRLLALPGAPAANPLRRGGGRCIRLRGCGGRGPCAGPRLPRCACALSWRAVAAFGCRAPTGCRRRYLSSRGPPRHHAPQWLDGFACAAPGCLRRCRLQVSRCRDICSVCGCHFLLWLWFDRDVRHVYKQGGRRSYPSVSGCPGLVVATKCGCAGSSGRRSGDSGCRCHSGHEWQRNQLHGSVAK